ncbi:hypothetical protein CSHISOI_03347 [Colletotrichum shisoi]|uniref:Uncharacterized protein n=1 Tax=Colletotrichum shisoi TaxID=2078593 RepID=A0A5Q4BZX3_9PEZI|nr:hypothetical protein CSHISOI_03347 [Colletotrichum shisoi]
MMNPGARRWGSRRSAPRQTGLRAEQTTNHQQARRNAKRDGWLEGTGMKSAWAIDSVPTG